MLECPLSISSITSYSRALRSSSSKFLNALPKGAEKFTTPDAADYCLLQSAERSDDFIAAVKSAETRPSQRIRIPGETAFNNLQKGDSLVDVLINRWEPFFDYIAGQYGSSEASPRDDFRLSTQPR